MCSFVVYEVIYCCYFGDFLFCMVIILNEGVGDNVVFCGVLCSIWMVGVERGGGVLNG